MMTRASTGHVRAGMLAAGMALAADQSSKWWILHVLDLPARRDVAVVPGLDLTMAWNPGVTFGLLRADTGTGRAMLVIAALVVVVALVVGMGRARRLRGAVARGLVAGGALGNMADRLRLGSVVDFVRVHAAGWSWYVFNVADAAILCGICLLLLDGLDGRAESVARPQPDGVQ